MRELAASTVEDYAAPRWSPDGKWIAVSRFPHATSAGSILLVDPNSAERRVLGRREPHGLLSGVAWVNEGEAVVYAEFDAITGVSLRRGAGAAAIVLQDVSDGDARVLLRNAHGAADTVDVVGPGRLVFTVTPETFAVSPDGTRAVLSVIDEASGLMMAEGVADVARRR
ncbi:MAG: hypothetical protein AABO58_18820 [Acidobacteriota bacterium]